MKRKVTISAKRARELLGKRRFFAEQRRRTKLPGVATGLAWTPVGGEVLFVEATAMPGDGKLDHHRPDRGRDARVRAGRALVGARPPGQAPAELPEDWFATHDIHIHVPAGAVPKDGPSAGVAMAVALSSLVTAKPVSSDVAMTGEVTLTGQVLPIGGLKEKALAAAEGRHQAGAGPRPERGRRRRDPGAASGRDSSSSCWTRSRTPWRLRFEIGRAVAGIFPGICCADEPSGRGSC